MCCFRGVRQTAQGAEGKRRRVAVGDDCGRMHPRESGQVLRLVEGRGPPGRALDRYLQCPKAALLLCVTVIPTDRPASTATPPPSSRRHEHSSWDRELRAVSNLWLR